MKLIKRILLALVLVIAGIIILNYPKLNIISGFAAKNMASNRFIAARTVEAVTKEDHNVPMIKLADVEVHEDEVAATVYGLMERKSVCTDGLGCVLITDDFDINEINYKPNRTKIVNGLPLTAKRIQFLKMLIMSKFKKPLMGLLKMLKSKKHEPYS